MLCRAARELACRKRCVRRSARTWRSWRTKSPSCSRRTWRSSCRPSGSCSWETLSSTATTWCATVYNTGKSVYSVFSARHYGRTPPLAAHQQGHQVPHLCGRAALSPLALGRDLRPHRNSQHATPQYASSFISVQCALSLLNVCASKTPKTLWRSIALISLVLYSFANYLIKRKNIYAVQGLNRNYECF